MGFLGRSSDPIPKNPVPRPRPFMHRPLLETVPLLVHLILIRTKFVCRQRAVLSWTVVYTASCPVLAARHECRSAIVLHDGDDVSDWRSLVGVVEICRPVNNPPLSEYLKRAAAVTPREPQSRVPL